MKITKSRKEREGGFCGKINGRRIRAGWMEMKTLSHVCGEPVYVNRLETLRELAGCDDEDYGYDF